MGNHRIGITAEFVSLIKSGADRRYDYFVSNKTKKIYKLVSTVFPKKSIENIFQNRLALSKEFDEFIIKNNNFETVVEFGSGYSLRGLEYALKNKGKTYIDTDFEEVIGAKKQALNEICEKYKIILPGNYVILPIDVLNDDIGKKLEKCLKNKNLFLAEGLTSYFSLEEYSKFLSQLHPFLEQPQNVFFSQENFLKKRPAVYRALRKLVAILTKNRSYIKFETKDDLIKFLIDKGFRDCQAYYKNGHLFYRIN
jgi:O-methyltransferase involved in polyketide biosynthesis